MAARKFYVHIGNLHNKFLAENTDMKISCSIFCRHPPAYIVCQFYFKCVLVPESPKHGCELSSPVVITTKRMVFCRKFRMKKFTLFMFALKINKRVTYNRFINSNANIQKDSFKKNLHGLSRNINSFSFEAPMIAMKDRKFVYFKYH